MYYTFMYNPYKGISSKQIADKPNISLHTVNRHRQDILSSLRVNNTAAAGEIGLRLHFI
ncbi:LuxR C-terminal-related transcriptional regulator [Bacteroides rodentium]